MCVVAVCDVVTRAVRSRCLTVNVCKCHTGSGFETGLSFSLTTVVPELCALGTLGVTIRYSKKLSIKNRVPEIARLDS